MCRKRRISAQYNTLNKDGHFLVGKNQVRSGVGQKRGDSILNTMLTSYTRGQQSTSIPTLKHRDSVPILLAQQTPCRTRLIEYTVLFIQTQQRSPQTHDTRHSNNVKDTQHRQFASVRYAHTQSVFPLHEPHIKATHAHISELRTNQKQDDVELHVVTMLLDAHLLKAATPTVNTGNRSGRECQDATAVGTRVVWVDGLVPVSRNAAALPLVDISLPCSVK